LLVFPAACGLGAEGRKVFEYGLYRTIGRHHAAIGVLARSGNGSLEFAPAKDATRPVVNEVGAQRETHAAGRASEFMLQPDDLGIESQLAGCGAGRQCTARNAAVRSMAATSSGASMRAGGSTHSLCAKYSSLCGSRT